MASNSSIIMDSWKNLPDVVFCDIIMKIGLNSLEDLHKCRQVSQSWNMMTAQMTKHKKVNIRKKAESLASQFREESRFHLEVLSVTFKVSLLKIVTAASLVHHGMLDSVEVITLRDVDLASVPGEHLASLASCVTESVLISNVSNCDLTSVLDRVTGPVLSISRQTLSSEETRALVRAMDSRVELVCLGEEGEVSLDMTALTQYSGQGKCDGVICHFKTADRNREEVRIWAEKINWVVTRHTQHWLLAISSQYYDEI